MSKSFERIAKRANKAIANPEDLISPFYHPAGMSADEQDLAVRRAARQAWDSLSVEEQVELIRERPQLAALCQSFLH